MRFFCFIFFLFLINEAYPQEVDSTLIPSDTTSQTKKYDVDTVIFASSNDSLIFNIKEKKMYLYGNSDLQYKETDLKASNIAVDFTTSNIEASGAKNDSGKTVGLPVLSERGEVYEGVAMKYNFKTMRGNISGAETEAEGAYYTGLKINKVDKETYFIEDGLFTTCEIDTPHYHFYANEMKVIHKEQVISKWVWLYFGGVPFPIPLPFGVFPIQSGRRSGILAPAFGDDGTYGKYLSRFGYFWAINDYMDLNLTADWYTRGSYNISSRYRYAKRYNFVGQLQAYYSFAKSGEEYDPDYSEAINWNLRWDHNQNIDPTMRFDAGLQFVSGAGYSRRTSMNINEQMNREIISNANLSKSWEESGNSLSLSYQRNQNLETGNIQEALPILRFYKSQSYPFKSKFGTGSPAWYENFGYSYNGSFQNNRNKINGDLKIRGGIDHNLNLTISPKVGYFNFTPYFNYRERWYNKKIGYFNVVNTAGRDTIVEQDIKEINFVRTFNTGISTATTFYGMFQPGMLGIAALRHTVRPSLTYNYTPNFSTDKWGYYNSYLDASGREIRYDQYGREIFGSVGASESQQISMSISNIFEMKTSVDPSDTTSKERKIQLLNFDARLGYNFAADSLKLSPLNLGYRTQIGEFFSLQGSSTYSFYENTETRSEINKFLISNGKRLFRLTNFNFNISTSISGERLKAATASDKPENDLPEDEFEIDRRSNVYKGLYDDEEADFTIPWSLSLSYYYSLSKPTKSVVNRMSNINGNIDFNLTPNWKFTFTGSYDLINKKFAAPQIMVSRDLHCWIMNFTWNPIGQFTGYRFEIRVKASQLQDLKLTKRDNFYSGK